MTENALVVADQHNAPASTSQTMPTASRSLEEHAAWPLLSTMPMHLSVALPIVGFCIGSLMQLQPGDLLETRHAISDDVPLSASRVPIATGEFEVIEDHLSLRITQLA